MNAFKALPDGVVTVVQILIIIVIRGVKISDAVVRNHAKIHLRLPKVFAWIQKEKENVLIQTTHSVQKVSHNLINHYQLITEGIQTRMCIPYLIILYYLATCSDGVQNGNETGIDCGGVCPNKCSKRKKNRI